MSRLKRDATIKEVMEDLDTASSRLDSNGLELAQTD